jgi:SM-20-related protein
MRSSALFGNFKSGQSRIDVTNRVSGGVGALCHTVWMTAAFESWCGRSSGAGIAAMIDLNRISRKHLETEPYRWAAIDELFSQPDGAALAATFPDRHFKRLADYDGSKEFEYEIRCLVRMGGRSISRIDELSDSWRTLANEFLSPGYRAAMSSLTSIDLSNAPLEVNLFRYPPGGSHGAHPDHRNKVVTHVIYFNESWSHDHGGCLEILRSSDPRDIAMRVWPVIGNSAVLVRSADSWHAVARVTQSCRLSRHSLTATFYRPGCVSTVWPSWTQVLLHDYPSRVWNRLKRRVKA